ncbi:MAG: hypothetical protein ACUVSK_13935 [Desulfotomaculales bacterium]
MLYVEPARMPGYVTSPKVESFIRFLEATGGAPPDACYLVFKRAGELFSKARAAGYAVAAQLGTSSLWLPVRHYVREEAGFRWQEALGWFFARLLEAGGQVKEGGAAVFPNGQEMQITVRAKGGEVVAVGEGKKYAWAVADLKTMKLGESVKKIA